MYTAVGLIAQLFCLFGVVLNVRIQFYSFFSELYYKNVNVTQKQENVNEALKTICCLLDATPWELGVLSTSKGLIAGPLQIHLPDDVVIDCGIDRNGNSSETFLCHFLILILCQSSSFPRHNVATFNIRHY